MIQCSPFEKSCLESNGYLDICAVGYFGPLCQTCLQNYAKYGGLECRQCFSKGVNYFFIIIFEIFSFVFFAIYIK